MKNITRLILPLAILLPLLLGCNAIQKGIEQASTPHDIVSDDGAVQLTVPALWTKKTESANSDISLQAAYVSGSVYVAVIHEPRTGSLEKYSLDEYTELFKTTMPKRMTDINMTPTTNVTINGLDGRQFEASGTIQGQQFKYVYTILADKGEFYQVYSWTSPANFDSNHQAMIDVTNSFKSLKSTGLSTESDNKSTPKKTR
jgi:hypothetical protein